MSQSYSVGDSSDVAFCCQYCSNLLYTVYTPIRSLINIVISGLGSHASLDLLWLRPWLDDSLISCRSPCLCLDPVVTRPCTSDADSRRSTVQPLKQGELGERTGDSVIQRQYHVHCCIRLGLSCH